MGKVKRRMLINALFGGMAYMSGMLVSIFMTPFLLRRLTDEVYGLIPLINSLVIFLSLVSMGINAALGRYVTYHLARGEDDEANQYFTTGCGLLTGLAMLGLGPLLAIVIVLPHLFNLPAGYAVEAQWVALVMGLNCLVNIVGTPLGVPLYATQRLALRYSFDILDVIIRTGLIVAAFLCIRAQVIYVAIATLTSTCVIVAARYRVSRLVVPQLRLARRFFRRERLRSIFSFSFYMVLTSVGVMLLLKTDILLVNWLFGSTAVTRYSLVSRWNPMIRRVLWTMLAVVTPVVTALQAAGYEDKIRETMLRGMRYALLLAVLPCVLFPIFAPQFLTTWVGAKYAGMAPVLMILIIPLSLVIASQPISIVLRGMGRVRFPSLVTVCGAIVNLGLSIILATVGGMGMLGIAVATAIVCVVTAVLVYPTYAARRLGLSPAAYFRGYLRPALACIPMVAAAVWMYHSVDLVGWPRLLAGYAVCSVIYLIPAYAIGLRRDDRAILWQTIGLSRVRRDEP